MNFKRITQWLILSSLIMLLIACSDEATEKQLVSLHTTAAQDVSTIEFPASTEEVVSINSLTAFSVQGLKSNGTDRVSLTSQIDWSLSGGALSSIDQDGRLTAAPTAESITVYATLGILSTSIDIRISAAKFDQVVSLNPDDKLPINIEMCQSQTITPFGNYIDANGNVEYRKVDNNVIKTIGWSILNKADGSKSQNAYIETLGSTTTLYSLAAGDLIVQATATSAYSGNEATYEVSSQTIGNGLDSVKICYSSATDYASCSVTNPSVEQDKEISFVAIGQYASGSYQNISRTGKWGISNENMTAGFSNSIQQIDVKGSVVPADKDSTTSSLYVACGDIKETITGNITQGTILDSSVECSADTGTDCKSSYSNITIKQLSVESLTVKEGNNELTNATTYTLSTRPDEIVLKVFATYDKNSAPVEITDNAKLTHVITDLEGNKVIEDKENTPGTFTVLNAGKTQIQFKYSNGSFTAIIEVPETL